MWRITLIFGVVWMHLPSLMSQKAEIYRCPKGLSGDVYTFREKCYQFISEDKHWTRAHNDCQIKGGNLVHIPDQTTQNFIYNTVKTTLKWPVNGMWIGLHDTRIKNTWEWVNGNPANPGLGIDYSNWGKDQPSCGFTCIEHCGQMRLDDYGRWHDVQCHATFFFREEKYRSCCMYDMGPRTTTTTTTKSTTPTTTTTTRTTTTLPTTLQKNATTEKKSTAENTTLAPTAPSTSSTGSTRNNENAVDSGVSTPIVVIVGAQGSKKVESRDGSIEGGTVAGIVIGCLVALCLLLLLLLVLLRRRKQKNPEERPSENFQNQTYSGAVTASGPALAYVNPQAETATYLNPTLSVRLPEKTEEKFVENPYSECMDNQYNACAAAAAGTMSDDDDDMGYSKGIYEDIKLDMQSDLSSDDDDDDLKGMKNKTPSVEYLHARNVPSTSPAPIPVPARNLFSEEHAAEDNIYVPMESGNDNDPVYQ